MHYKGLYQNMFINMQRSVFRDIEYSGDSSQSTVTLLHSESSQDSRFNLILVTPVSHEPWDNVFLRSE